MKTVVLILALALMPLRAPAQPGECVVLLHGLLRSSASMAVMAEALERAGYRVVNRGYDSTKAPIGELVARALPRRCPNAARRGRIW